jgi:hypothetical protein
MDACWKQLPYEIKSFILYQNIKVKDYYRKIWQKNLGTVHDEILRTFIARNHNSIVEIHNRTLKVEGAMSTNAKCFFSRSGDTSVCTVAAFCSTYTSGTSVHIQFPEAWYPSCVRVFQHFYFIDKHVLEPAKGQLDCEGLLTTYISTKNLKKGSHITIVDFSFRCD